MIKILLPAILLILASCHSTKEIEKTQLNDDKELIRIRDSSARVIREQAEAYNRHIEELIKSGVTFEECPPCMNRDSILQLLDSAGRTRYLVIEQASKIRELSNKVKINADGSIEAEGRIRSALMAKSRTDDELRLVKLRSDSLQLVADTLRMSQKTSVETIVKKKTTRPWIPWGLLALLAVWYVYREWKLRKG